MKTKIDVINPEYIFRKGYSVIFDEKGKAIRSSKDLEIGQEVQIKFYRGVAGAEIKNKKQQVETN